MSYTIVIDDAVVEAEALFSPYGKTIIVPGRDIPMHAAQADALIIRSRTQITQQLLQENPRIRFIGSTVVGLDHIDQVACQSQGVTFYSAQGCNARSVAEYVLSQIIAYASAHDYAFEQLTLAIIGVGHVGTQVQQLAKVLGIHLLLNDPFRAESEPDFCHTPLTDCLAQADIITLHTPLTHEGKHPTYQLIHQHNIQRIPAQALFINAARGDIVDEDCLIARNDLHIITDCWSNEPYINERLLDCSQLATPHIAGHAWDAKFRGGMMARNALAQWLNQTIEPVSIQTNITQHASPQSSTPIKQLAELVQQAYHFTQDDIILRQAQPSARAQCFEDYRRNYPMRREWFHHRLPSDSLSPTTRNWAIALGFLN